MANHKSYHGTTKAKGCSHMRLGNFGRMFPKLSSWSKDTGIKEQCDVEKIMALLGGPNGLMHDVNGQSDDSELPAGYTFFAQFIDHDITLDTSSQLHSGPDADANNVDALPNLRSASLDMDCVYGFGPEANPFLYDGSQPGRMLVGNKDNPNDLARNDVGTALIGDPRNDENIFVAQMQLLMIKFHNKRLLGRGFEEAQEDVRFHYQWIVLYDFLKRICDPAVYDFALDKLKTGAADFPATKSELVDAAGNVKMPVEFSVAAYRFGHTTVRSIYPANHEHPVVELFDEAFGTEGFSGVPEELTVDWTCLLDVEKCSSYVKAKAFDHLLPDELIQMPNPIVGKFASPNDRSLAFRNLLRGYALGLPSGQKVAAELASLGYPISGSVNFKKIEGWSCLPDGLDKTLAEHTPLFFYMMVEAGQLGKGKHLGPVASAILMEVFGAMLTQCGTFLSHKGWRPDPCIAKDPDNRRDKELTLSDIARYVNG